MLTKLTLISSIALFAIAAVWLIELCVVKEKDISFYQDLLQKKELARAESSPYSSTNQYRKKVRKDIWFAQDDPYRLHYRIESLGSTLTLIPENNKFNVTESLDGIKCWMQEKLYYSDKEQLPMQQSRYIEADEGTYEHASQEFIAQGVAISFFHLPGHCLPNHLIDTKKAFLSGIAKDISFSVSGKTPQFQAKQFTASINKENDQ